jgi:hypothetical protein
MGRFIDLTGQRFGKLLVISQAKNRGKKIQWNCICDCGGKKAICSSHLRKGEVKRCCLGSCTPLHFKNLVGQRFGLLTVISRAENDKNKRIRWNCICDCGNKLTPYSDSLLAGKSKSCGSCIKIKNLTGLRFGKLTVISPADRNRSNQIQWNCLCDCGKKCVILSKCLLYGTTRSCGCLKTSNKYTDKTMSSKLALFGKYKRSARDRGYSFEINFETFMSFVQQDCYYCGESSSHYFKHTRTKGGFFYTGLDRIENEKGYESNNLNPCCKKVQLSKAE